MRRPCSAVFVAGLMAAGCATVGNGKLVELDPGGATTLLVPGRTTQADVLAALGQGSVVKFESGYETWFYVYRKGISKGWDDVPYIGLVTSRLGGDTKELVILFDAAGTLRRWSLEAQPAHERKAPG